MGIFDASALPSGPTSKSIATSGIAPWAQPYINSYLNRAQGLVNQGPTNFQNQVYSSAQNMGTPEQFGQGSNLANQAGQGQLSTAPQALQYGQQGVGIGALGLGYGMNAGQNYANQATNPNAVGAYMNPYVQQSLAPQLGLLNQQQQLASQGINAKAVGQGAFGGNRATLAQGLNAQNYDLARQQAIGQGYNEAFKNAQQAQQFGSTLGLQGAMQGTSAGLAGLNTALQGVQGAQQGYTGATQAGAALGNIGAQQGQYDLSKMALQNQIANQQYNQPFQNLQFMQSMMNGLPISSQTTQGYQAPPNAFSQIGGFGTTLIGGFGAANKAGLFDGAGKLFKNFGGGSSSSGFDNVSTDDIMSGNFAKGGKVQSYADGGDIQDVSGSPMGYGKFEQDQINAINSNQVDPMGAGIGNLIGSKLMPIDSTPVNSDELTNLYQQYLGRGVDESGAKSFTGLDRTTVLNGILNSPEYRGMQPQRQLLGNGISAAPQGYLGQGAQPQMFGRMIGAGPQGTDLANLQLNRLLGKIV